MRRYFWKIQIFFPRLIFDWVDWILFFDVKRHDLHVFVNLWLFEIFSNAFLYKKKIYLFTKIVFFFGIDASWDQILVTQAHVDPELCVWKTSLETPFADAWQVWSPNPIPSQAADLNVRLIPTVALDIFATTKNVLKNLTRVTLLLAEPELLVPLKVPPGQKLVPARVLLDLLVIPDKNVLR